MPLGIISESEFESELRNSNANITIPIINDSSNINFIPTNDSSNPRASKIQEINPSDIIQQSPKPEVISGSEARGRGTSNTQVPHALRKVIGETSVINGRRDALELAELFDVSPSSVSAYNKGAHSTSTINEPNADTLSHLNNAKMKVSIRARKKLNLALTHITGDKLEEAKVGEIASVARAMAGIIKDMEPDNNNEKNKSNIPFVVFAPVIVNEASYEVVHAKDDY